MPSRTRAAQQFQVQNSHVQRSYEATSPISGGASSQMLGSVVSLALALIPDLTAHTLVAVRRREDKYETRGKAPHGTTEETNDCRGTPGSIALYQYGGSRAGYALAVCALAVRRILARGATIRSQVSHGLCYLSTPG